MNPKSMKSAVFAMFVVVRNVQGEKPEQMADEWLAYMKAGMPEEVILELLKVDIRRMEEQQKS